MRVNLTETQINHLLTLLRDAEEEGSYYGRKDHFWKRHNDIVKALAAALRGDSQT